MKHTFSILETNIVLRPMSVEDSEKYRVLRNKNKEWFGNRNEIKKEDQEKWFEKYLTDESVLMFSIYDIEDRFIGGNSIYNINYNGRECEYGRFVIDKMWRGRNYGLYATIAAVSIAKKLLLKKISLEVLSTNIAAIKTYQKAGFRINPISYKASEMINMILDVNL